MAGKGKGKQKVTTIPMDSRKTRVLVTGHPDGNVNVALNSIMLFPPHIDKAILDSVMLYQPSTDNAYERHASTLTTITSVSSPAPSVNNLLQ